MKASITGFKLLTLGALVAIAACQGPTDAEWAEFCQNNIWAKHGHADATEGYPFKMAAVYRERCGPSFSEDDMSQYQLGYIKGLQEFCTWEKGYELAKKNKKNPDICPPEMSREFTAGYKEGRAEYAAHQNIRLQEVLDKERWEDNNRPPPMQRQ